MMVEGEHVGGVTNVVVVDDVVVAVVLVVSVVAGVARQEHAEEIRDGRLEQADA